MNLKCKTYRLHNHRRGVAVLESAFVLPVTLLVVFALLDLGLAALRYNMLVDASQCIAREAAVRGEMVSDIVTSWGPTAFSGTAADPADILDPIRQRLPTMAPELVSVEVIWPDTGNSPRDRVQVELLYQHQPLVPALFPWGTLDLQSTTTLRIVN